MTDIDYMTLTLLGTIVAAAIGIYYIIWAERNERP